MTAPSTSRLVDQRPALAVIQQHLKLIAAPYIDAGLSGLIALRTLPSGQHKLFEFDDLPAASDWAYLQCADEHQNVYVAPGLFGRETRGAGVVDMVVKHCHPILNQLILNKGCVTRRCCVWERIAVA